MIQLSSETSLCYKIVILEGLLFQDQPPIWDSDLRIWGHPRFHVTVIFDGSTWHHCWVFHFSDWNNVKITLAWPINLTSYYELNSLIYYLQFLSLPLIFQLFPCHPSCPRTYTRRYFNWCSCAWCKSMTTGQRTGASSLSLSDSFYCISA